MKRLYRGLIKVIIFILKSIVMISVWRCKRFTVFHNVKTLWGESIKSAYDFYYRWHYIDGRPLILQSREGLILLIHGLKDGRMMLSKTHRITIEELASMLPPGKYNLLSCYNGSRRDYKNGGIEIVRVDRTRRTYISNQTTFFGKNLYVVCNWELHALHQLQKKLIKLM